ncbi:larval cuticle protein 65Ag1-like [Anopheles bellator]|uniref:larval cuticle protein 65Ag1-like n=1 Tax=Anopheles bellator TaxID=139047 RepID=UPI002649EEAE|nr:larval cuticle protein 65Ag1-like [Anopheles bellator]
MKTLIAFTLLALVAVAVANQNAKTLRYENVQEGDGSYKFAFESDDGIARQEQGESVGEEAGINVQGNFKFVADDGQEYEVQYVADKDGFHPEGAHIPKEYVQTLSRL